MLKGNTYLSSNPKPIFKLIRSSVLLRKTKLAENVERLLSRTKLSIINWGPEFHFKVTIDSFIFKLAVILTTFIRPRIYEIPT